MFYSGFGLDLDEAVKSSFYHESEYSIAGFSYGAQHAVESALQQSNRLDCLQLFSPAFFQHKEASFITEQLDAYEKSPRIYMKRFVRNATAPYRYDIAVTAHDKRALKTLLSYRFKREALQQLKERGVNIEVYLSRSDKIIDYEPAYAFFKPYASVITFNHANHLLYFDEGESSE